MVIDKLSPKIKKYNIFFLYFNPRNVQQLGKNLMCFSIYFKKILTKDDFSIIIKTLNCVYGYQPREF